MRRAALLLIPLIAVAPAGAQTQPDRPQLSFSPVSLALEWTNLVATVEVFNETTRTLRLSFRLTPLRAQGARVEAAAVLALAPTQETVPAGSSIQLTLARAAGASKPADGSYAGRLVAYEPGGDAFGRVELTLAVPSAAKAPAKVESLVDPVTVTVFRRRWLLGWLGDKFDTRWFADRYPTPSSVDVPLKTKEAPTGLGAETELGALRSGTEVVVVRSTGTAALPSGHHAVGLEFLDLSRGGDYEGKLQLAPAGPAADAKPTEVMVKLAYTDFIWLPLFVLIGGVLTGLVVSRQIGVAIPAERLEDAVDALDDEYAETKELFREAGKGTDWVGWHIDVPYESARTGLLKQIGALRRTYLTKIEKESKDAVLKDVTAARTHVDAFAALGRKMQALEEKVDEIETVRPQGLVSPQGKPHAAAELRRKLLRQRDFSSFEEIKSVHEDVETAVDDCVAWQDLERVVAAARAEIKKAQAAKKDVGTAETELWHLYVELWERTTVEAASSGDLGTRLATLRTNVQKLPTPGEAVQPPADTLEPLGPGAPPAPAQAAEPTAAPSVGKGNTLVSWIGRLFAADLALDAWAHAKANAVVEERLGGWRQLILLVLALVLAIASALGSEYVGKAFGASVWEYLKLFAWGFGTKIVLDTVVNGLDSIGVLRLARR